MNICERCEEPVVMRVVQVGFITGAPNGMKIKTLIHKGGGIYCLPEDIVNIPYVAKCSNYHGEIEEVSI